MTAPVLELRLARPRRRIPRVGVRRLAPDVAACAPRHLAESAFSQARGEVESSRFRRLARVYAVAASVLAAAGVAGALLARAPEREVATARPPSVHDLEEARLTRVGLDSVSHLTVDGR
jgi:hypothetical protein